jgi:DNA-binding MarR family transcriptional regulator
MSITLNDDAVLIILALDGAEGAQRELRELTDRDCIRVATVLDELVQRGLVECVDGEYDPTVKATIAACEAETERVRALAIAGAESRERW